MSKIVENGTQKSTFLATLFYILYAFTYNFRIRRINNPLAEIILHEQSKRSYVIKKDIAGRIKQEDWHPAMRHKPDY